MYHNSCNYSDCCRNPNNNNIDNSLVIMFIVRYYGILYWAFMIFLLFKEHITGT